MNSLDLKPKVLIKEVFHLERRGRYDEALQRLGDIWENRSELPNVKEFSKFDAAEITLRCGSIFGFDGHLKQIPESQERSKDLITEAYNRFLELNQIEKIAECENNLALCYWRKGEFAEAEAWVNSSLSYDLPNSSDVRLYSYVIRNILTNENKNYLQSIKNYRSVEQCFTKYASPYLKGIIYSNVGIANRNLGNKDETLKFFKLSRKNYQAAGHLIYSATLENNFALFHKSTEEFDEAHCAIDTAADIFLSINDQTRYGFSFDTKALIYFEEGKYQKALECVDQGIGILRTGENVNYLVETITTKIKTLIKLNKITQASLCLAEAIDLAKRNINEAKAKAIAQDFANALNNKETPVFLKIHSEREFVNEDLTIVLPPEISHFEEIEGVWIKNSHLEPIGLRKGSLAIVAKDDEIIRGDLVAILERESEEVVCGFYDIDFGIICLEALDRKPLLFDEYDIQILGKIVGVAENKLGDSNKIYVEPIDMSE